MNADQLSVNREWVIGRAEFMAQFTASVSYKHRKQRFEEALDSFVKQNVALETQSLTAQRDALLEAARFADIAYLVHDSTDFAEAMANLAAVVKQIELAEGRGEVDGSH